MKESGTIKAVLLPYAWCSFALFTLMYVAMTGGGKSDLMTTCSICLEEDIDNPSCPVCTCLFQGACHQVPKIPPCSNF